MRKKLVEIRRGNPPFLFFAMSSKIFQVLHSSPAFTAHTVFGKIWDWFLLVMTEDTARMGGIKREMCKILVMTEGLGKE